eukprot:TRINITY_DN47983_c0_g1_i1.p1 TRINITY_DN47983_c0_g1~~TRINITY_DN47983_c0_g1_i1.p1  ORF type:complete len:190 (-),score=46.19 TRINITY_DN47983_c0_g1_i1:53-622(-)
MTMTTTTNSADLGDFSELFYLTPEEQDRRKQVMASKIRAAFALFERDHSGAVDPKEIGTILRSLGINPSEAQVAKMTAMMGVEELGFVRLENFQRVALEVLRTHRLDGELITRDTEEDILRAFAVLDSEAREYLDAEDLKDHLMTHCEKFAHDEVLELLNCAADPETGMVKYVEYAAVLAYDTHELSVV